MKARPGVALMLVLWIIVVLGTVASSVAVATRSVSAGAAHYRASVAGRYAAESGVTAAVALLEATLSSITDEPARRAYLNQLDRALGEQAELQLGDAQTLVTLVDLNARLDLNTASVESIATLFGFFATPRAAAAAAAALHARLPLNDPDELERIEGLPRELIVRAAPYLTIDGDGSINRAVASDTVLAAAGGDLRDEPSRIMIISRGRRTGDERGHEIQAVYAIQGNDLALVRMRGRDR